MRVHVRDLAARVPHFLHLVSNNVRHIRCSACGEVLPISINKERGILCCQGYKAGHAIQAWGDPPSPQANFKAVMSVYFDRLLASPESEASDMDAMQEERDEKIYRYYREQRMTLSVAQALWGQKVADKVSARERLEREFAGHPDLAGQVAGGVDPLDAVFGETPLQRSRKEFAQRRKAGGVEERTVGGDYELKPWEKGEE